MGKSISELIKRLAIGAVDARAPIAILFGKVTSSSPLEITIEQKLRLTKEFLILTKNVKDYTVDITEGNSETKTITIHNKLKLNDNVILVQQQGGTNFVVLDKF